MYTEIVLYMPCMLIYTFTCSYMYVNIRQYVHSFIHTCIYIYYHILYTYKHRHMHKHTHAETCMHGCILTYRPTPKSYKIHSSFLDGRYCANPFFGNWSFCLLADEKSLSTRALVVGETACMALQRQLAPTFYGGHVYGWEDHFSGRASDAGDAF